MQYWRPCATGRLEENTDGGSQAANLESQAPVVRADGHVVVRASVDEDLDDMRDLFWRTVAGPLRLTRELSRVWFDRLAALYRCGTSMPRSVTEMRFSESLP